MKMFDDLPGDDMEGHMTVPSTASKTYSQTPGSPNFNTLDEPIRETFVNINIVITRNS